MLGTITYENSCEEIYDVQILPEMGRPGIVGLETDMHLRALSTPEETFWMAPEEEDGDG